MKTFPHALTAAMLLLPGLAAADSVVVFNELHYHPAGTLDPAGEWVELRNQMAVDVDLSGWSLAAGVSYTFPEGTIIPARGYLVVAATPPVIPGSLGPWTGRLDNGGETIELRNNNSRVMDRLEWQTDGDWPIAPDGSGPTLAKRAMNLATSDPASWSASRQSGGTPGRDNFPELLPPVTATLLDYSDTWKVESSGNDPGATWKDAGFADDSWATGSGVFQLGSPVLPSPITAGSVLPSGPRTYYFRKSFQFSGQAAYTTLRLRLLADDGAAVWINGAELVRINLPAGAGHSSTALQPRRGDPRVQEFLVPGSALTNGTNWLAVELHQAAPLPSYPAAVLASGPVAYWRLGESGGTLSDLAELTAAPESGAQEGSFSGFAPANLAQPGPRPGDSVGGQPLLGFETINTAPAFQGNNDGGNDVALFPDNGTMNFGPGKKFTWEAWVKAPPTGHDDGGAVITKGSGGGGEQFACDIVSGTYRFFCWDGGNPNTPVVAQSAVAPNNTWQHLTGVFDQAQGIMKLYVNGVQAATTTPRPTLLSNTHEVSVGARQNSGSGGYDLNMTGTVDEVALYPRALTPAEITAHYNAAFAAGPAGHDTADAVFGLTLEAIQTLPAAAPPTLVFNEIAAADTAAGAVLELTNTGSSPVALEGFFIDRLSTGVRADFIFPAQSINAGSFLAVDAATLNFPLIDGDRLVLFSPAGIPLDGVTIKQSPRGRYPDGTGPWLRPSTASFGSANQFALHGEIVINEIMFHPPSPPLAAAAVSSQWIELHNKSTAPVDISGWRFDGTVDFTFPAGTTMAAGAYLVVAGNPATLPGIGALGPWSGSLSRNRDRIVLKDAAGNPADEAVYYSGGHWAEYADGGGSSLELIDARADNTHARSWAASDESSKAPWQTFTWRGPANLGIAGEPTQWREINLCLLDGPGEVLIDDVSVTDTTNSQNLIQNGNFNSGMTKWRATGTHRLTGVQAEPGVPGNQVLRVVATGPGEYQGNQIESTFLNNTALVTGREYEISLRARWIAGGGKLNARLYFNRLARTHDLAVSAKGGTPGQANSRALANIGPSITGMMHAPAVPAAGQTFTVRAEAADPDGPVTLALKYAVNGGAWQTVPMTSAEGKQFSATVPGQAAAALIQFYVEAADSIGAVSQHPPGGANSRAMCMVQDGQAAPNSPAKFRLIMTAADAASMHANVNCLSNGFLGSTIIADEREIYYDTGVRLKGSYVGRNVPRVGFSVRFQPDKPFRGIHDKVAVDRSQHVAVAQGEIVAKHIAGKAGGIPNTYDDIGRFVHVIQSYNSSCQLRLTGFEDDYLDSSFPDGSDGHMYEYEVLRWTTATSDNTVDGTKLPGNGYSNPDLQNQGDSEEAYRWNFLASNHRNEDDFTSPIAVGKLFSLTGTAFDTESKKRLDVDQWLRALAFQTLTGPNDVIYTGSNIHNIRFFTRAHDGRMMYMPWDWDSSWSRATNAALTGGGNTAKVVTVNAHNQRQYLCHVFDLVNTTFNTAYMSRWTQHYAAVAGEDYSAILSYIGARAAYALTQLPTATAWTGTAGTVNANGAVTLTGTGNIRVAFIEVNGLAYAPVWTSNTAWTITVPLAQGDNALTLRGLDKDGLPVSGASSSLNVTNPNAPGWPVVRINEWLAENDGSHLDPADGKSDDWLEIHNPTGAPVDLSNWSLSDVPAQPRLSVLPAGTIIPAGGFLLVWADNEPVQSAPGSPHVSFKLSNTGETIGLYAPDSRLIDSVSFGEQKADISGGRYTDSAPDVFTLTTPTPAAPNVLLALTSHQNTPAGVEISFTTTPGRRYRVESSEDLVAWTPLTADTLATGPVTTVTDPAATPRRFYQVLVLP